MRDSETAPVGRRTPGEIVRWGSLALATALFACTPQSAEPVDTTVVSPAPATSTAPGLEIVGCGQAGSEVAIVCEAYDLIQRHYVDRVSSQELAEAAEQGVSNLEDRAAGSVALTCPAPAASFDQVCRLAADRAGSNPELARAMVAGMARYALDPNSAYLGREELQLLEEEQDGEIQGIGALVIAEDRTGGEDGQCSVIEGACRMVVVSTVPGSPADVAGLAPDDVIVEVDDDPITGLSVDQVTARVRGAAGSEVRLTVERGGDRLDLTITRQDVVIPIVESEVVGGAGYLRLNMFSDAADEQFESALAHLLEQDIDTLVVDLRDNPGGLLDTAVEVVSDFLADGEVVVTEGPDSSTSYEVSGDPLVPADLDVVIVVNRGSASASEVVSAVLQERGRVTVVGEHTFGKNTVQQRFGLSDGGALKLTIARWVTPEGADFGGVGVTPDVEKELGGLTVDQVVQEALAASRTI